ncbi:Metallo-beta-lactamase domain-containing protein [Deinococcus saxicola]|uniref:MBL fold metallo-hydrolase n=1 Tax=Deinococcus saxicola TaxID=249406 RepID=UPI0039F0021D
MKLNNDLLVLELTADFGTGPSILNAAVILDSQAGHTLVDTGMPGMEGAIETALAEVGATLKDIKQVIITHHDLDHIGSLEAVKASGAQVLASARETSFIQGEEWPEKMPPQEQVAALLADPQTPPQMRARLSLPRVAVKVDRALSDGEVLPLAGGVRVVMTPGHTPGHLSLYLERTKTLITGDALTSDAGQLRPPGERATPDMQTAGQSVNKMAGLDVQTIMTYHGGVVRDDANAQLARVAAGMATN